MPNKQKPTRTQLAQLAGLPKDPDLVVEGGMRTLGVFLREGNETIQPQAALWLDTTSQVMRATQVINPRLSPDGGVGAALEALVVACVGPFDAPAPGLAPPIDIRRAGKGSTRGAPSLLPRPGLPASIRVNDVSLAEAARAIFEPLGVHVEQADHVPTFDAAFQSLSEFMGAEEAGTSPEPFAWDIDPALLPALYKAASGYWRRAPWTYTPDHPPLAIAVGEHGPQPGQDMLYASILGGGEMVQGVAFYYSLDDLRQAMRQGANLELQDADLDAAVAMLQKMGAPVDQIPRDMLHEVLGGLMAQEGNGGELKLESLQNTLVLFFAPVEESDPTYVDWLRVHRLKYPSREGVPSFFRTAPGTEPRSPDAQEARALTLALGATNQFFSQHGRLLETVFPPETALTHRAEVESGTDRVVLDVTFPPPDFAWDEEERGWDGPEEPASEAGQKTVYRFLVTLEWEPSVWRRIEVRGDQTLDDLHEAIQEAFDWDNDHLYAFFLSGKAWDDESAYKGPMSDGRSAARTRLEHLPLKRGKRVLYLFDFGDELRHTVKLEAIVPDGVESGAEYPRITERRGASVPQYPNVEDEEEDWEEDEGEEDKDE
jgi:Plasmid pRiA4b ORF-3-like protein